MKKKATKKVMKKKGTKRAAKKRRPADLSPRKVRGGAVKGGAVDIFAKIGDIKGESEYVSRSTPGSIMKF